DDAQPSPQPAEAEPLPPLEIAQEDLGMAIQWMSKLERPPSLGHIQAFAEHLACRERQLVALRKSRAAEVEKWKQELRAKADTAYCDYVAQMRRTECLGFEEK